MNLYKFHADPKSLHKHATKEDHVLELLWNKYRYDPEEMKKREKAISKNAEFSFYYARDINRRTISIRRKGYV